MSWHKTIEGKLALGVVGLLVVFGLLVARDQQQLGNELAVETAKIRQPRDLKSQQRAPDFAEQESLEPVESPAASQEDKPSDPTDTTNSDDKERPPNNSKNNVPDKSAKERKSYFDKLSEWLRQQ